jgi:hypothetical protein
LQQCVPVDVTIAHQLQLTSDGSETQMIAQMQLFQKVLIVEQVDGFGTVVLIKIRLMSLISLTIFGCPCEINLLCEDF